MRVFAPGVDTALAAPCASSARQTRRLRASPPSSRATPSSTSRPRRTRARSRVRFRRSLFRRGTRRRRHPPPRRHPRPPPRLRTARVGEEPREERLRVNRGRVGRPRRLGVTHHRDGRQRSNDRPQFLVRRVERVRHGANNGGSSRRRRRQPKPAGRVLARRRRGQPRGAGRRPTPSAVSPTLPSAVHRAGGEHVSGHSLLRERPHATLGEASNAMVPSRGSRRVRRARSAGGPVAGVLEVGGSNPVIVVRFFRRYRLVRPERRVARRLRRVEAFLGASNPVGPSRPRRRRDVPCPSRIQPEDDLPVGILVHDQRHDGGLRGGSARKTVRGVAVGVVQQQQVQRRPREALGNVCALPVVPYDAPVLSPEVSGVVDSPARSLEEEADAARTVPGVDRGHREEFAGAPEVHHGGLVRGEGHDRGWAVQQFRVLAKDERLGDGGAVDLRAGRGAPVVLEPDEMIAVRVGQEMPSAWQGERGNERER